MGRSHESIDVVQAPGLHEVRVEGTLVGEYKDIDTANLVADAFLMYFCVRESVAAAEAAVTSAASEYAEPSLTEVQSCRGSDKLTGQPCEGQLGHEGPCGARLDKAVSDAPTPALEREPHNTVPVSDVWEDGYNTGFKAAADSAETPDALREEVERLLDAIADLGIDTVNGPWPNGEMGDCGRAASAVRAILQAGDKASVETEDQR